MKNIMLFGTILALSACSLPQQQSSVPMDVQAVQAYQQRINTKNTVDKNLSQCADGNNHSVFATLQNSCFLSLHSSVVAIVIQLNATRGKIAKPVPLPAHRVAQIVPAE